MTMVNFILLAMVFQTYVQFHFYYHIHEYYHSGIVDMFF